MVESLKGKNINRALIKTQHAWVVVVIALLAITVLISSYRQNNTQTPGLESGNVIRIIDADSIEILSNGDYFRILELAYIDAPEREQPYGKEAIAFLSHQILNKMIQFKNIADKHEVFYQGLNINLEMVIQGMAWVVNSQPNSSEQQYYEQAKNKAMQKNRGIWQLDHDLRIPPWQWQKQATERSTTEVFKHPVNKGNILPSFIGQTVPPEQMQNPKQQKPRQRPTSKQQGSPQHDNNF